MLKKILLITFVVGLVSLISGLVITKGDFSKMIGAFSADGDYESAEASSTNSISSINIEVVNNNINLYRSLDDTIKINYFESENDTLEISFENNQLLIIGKYKSKFKFFTFRNKSESVKNVDIYLPVSFDGMFDLEMVAGNIKAEDFTFQRLDASLTSGKIELNNVVVETDLILSAVTGTIKMNNVKVTEEATFDLTAGTINVNIIEAKRMNLNLVTVTGKMKNITSNNIDMELTSGSFDISVVGLKDDYRGDLNVTVGTLYYDGVKLGSQKLNTTQIKSIKVNLTSGKAKIDFVE